MKQALDTFRRQLEFAVHIPPRQMIRRFLLVARRRLEQRLKPRLDSSALQTAAELPSPLFPSRTGSCSRQGGRWTFTFLGRTMEMAGAIDWSAPSADPAERLWRMHLHYMEYLEELSDADASEVILHWIAANPPYLSSAARDSWNAYVISLRAVVWMQQLARRSSLPGKLARSLPARSVDNCSIWNATWRRTLAVII